MLKKVIIISTIFYSSVAIAQSPDKYIWYKQPAKAFEESLVLGNDIQDAFVFNAITTYEIYLNDARIWPIEPYKATADTSNYKYLPAIRDALSKENYLTALGLFKKLKGQISQSFIILKTLYLQFNTNISLYSIKFEK